MPSDDRTRELPTTPSRELEVHHNPRRRRRVFVALSLLSAVFAVAGVLGWTMLPPLAQIDDAPPRATPHDLVTDGLGGPIAVETAPPTRERPGRTSAVVRGDAQERDPAMPTPGVTAGPGPSATPFFTCDTWSTVIQPGGVRRIGCRMYPAAYAGTIAMACGDLTTPGDCVVEPDRFDLRGEREPIPFSMVLTTPYGTAPSAYREKLRMVGASGQQRSLEVVVPAVVGTVAIDCPPTVTLATAGDRTVTCDVSSQDGFDGNVRIEGSSLFDGGSAQILAVDPVRVPLGETVSVDLTLRSTAVPLLPVLMELDVSPAGYVAETLAFLIAPLT